jgi:glucose-6-phosphate 1-epimerase
VLGAQSFTEQSSALTLTSETDRVYTPPTAEDGSAVPLTVTEDGTPRFKITRDGLPNVTVWNLWDQKAAAMGDFAPKDGWKNMICVEPGAVGSWIKLEAGDAWEGSQIMVAEPKL